jgi:hypothetical protein
MRSGVYLVLTMLSRVRLVEKTESPPGSRSTSPPGTVDSSDQPVDKVIIDPTKGGVMNPKASELSRALEVQPRCWPWEGLVKILQVDLYHPAWEARHGSAMALRDILKSQGECGGMKGKILSTSRSHTNSYFVFKTKCPRMRMPTPMKDGATSSPHKYFVSSS